MPVEFLATVGRAIVGAYFLLAGVGKIFSPNDGGQVAHMTSAGIPNADWLFPLAGACEIVGGLTLLLGLHTRLVAFLLASFVVLASVTMHKFWGAAATGDQEQFTQMIMFMKNMTTFAGLLAFVGFGSGPLAIDNLYDDDEHEVE
jgi:putative oxidoreductase